MKGFQVDNSLNSTVEATFRREISDTVLPALITAGHSLTYKYKP